MKKMKRIIAFFIALTVILSLCGCTKTPEPEVTTEPTTAPFTQNDGILKLAYSSSDSLNPFFCSTNTNANILGLVYDGLYKLDKNYNPVPVIAASYYSDSASVTVALAQAQFSDGTEIYPADVVNSFELAKESPAYSQKLKNFESATASGGSVTFTLSSPDPYAVSCLTFPIAKINEEEPEADFPTGSGRYIPQVSGEERYLIANAKKSGFAPAIKTIMLVNLKDEASLISSVEVGNTGFIFNNLSSGTYSRISAKTKDIGINNFVFLAFNPALEIFANTSVRQAINLAIDRSEISTTAYQGHARVAYSPFNPDWHMIASKDLIIPKNIEKGKELIAASGANVAQNELLILVNSENQFKLETAEFIKEYLEAIGFRIKLAKLSAENFASEVAAGNYAMYIGEIKLSPNMDISPLLTDESSGFKVNPESESAIRYTQLLEGKCEIMDFINTFNSDVPFIPLCYRNAAVSFSNSMQGGFESCDGDVFYDIETWSFK